MKSRMSISLLSLVLVSAFASQVLAGGPVTLRYKYNKGEKLLYHMMMKQNMTLVSSLNPGVPQVAGSKMMVDFHHKVVSQKGDKSQVEMGFDKVAAMVEMGGKEIPVPAIDELTKVRMKFDMDARGEMSAIELQGAESVGAQAQQIANEMKKSLAQNALVFPEKALEVGKSWTIDQQIATRLPGSSGGMVPMKVKSTYKYMGMKKHKDKQVARIDTMIKVSLHGKGQQMGTPIQADMEGAGDGVAYFDLAAGKLVESTADFLLKGKIVGGAKDKPVSTDMKIDMKVVMGLK